MKLKDLKQDGHNYRRHSDRNKALIKKSVEECGLGRSVVIDADGVLIAGNGVASVLDKHTPVRVVETDGSELVVVKRTDLHEGDVKRKKLAMADNAAADSVEWDVDALRADWGEDDLGEWDIILTKEQQEVVNEYSRKITPPVYEPTGEMVSIEDLIDTEKFKRLIAKIENSKVDEKTKTFLKFAAARHIIFDYEKIAEFYANSDKEVQDLFEDSALIIIDFKKAMEGGFITLSKKMQEYYEQEHGEL